MPTVILASGPVTNSDQLMIELVTPPDAPPAILIHWPGLGSPSVCAPTRFPAAALAAIAVLDDAMQELIRQYGTPR
jgi:hypothetical protein